MPSRTSPIVRCLIASALALCSSCAERVAPLPAPPADLFDRPARPVMPAEALESEAEFERWREDVFDWGQALDARLAAACHWLRDAGHQVICKEPR